MQGICFVDFELVPQSKNFFAQSDEEQVLFIKRFKSLIKERPAEDVYMENAGFTAEFGKICAVSTGTLVSGFFYVKKYAGTDEKELLAELGGNLESTKISISKIGGHNITDFDCPIAMRRYIANGMPVPKILNSMGAKSWDLPYRDTMKMWSGSEWNHKVSLEMLCRLLGVENPKQESDGGDIQYLYDSGDFKKMAEYCAGDMIAAAKCFAILSGEPRLRNDQIIFRN